MLRKYSYPDYQPWHEDVRRVASRISAMQSEMRMQSERCSNPCGKTPNDKFNSDSLSDIPDSDIPDSDNNLNNDKMNAKDNSVIPTINLIEGESPIFDYDSFNKNKTNTYNIDGEWQLSESDICQGLKRYVSSINPGPHEGTFEIKGFVYRQGVRRGQPYPAFLVVNKRYITQVQDYHICYKGYNPKANGTLQMYARMTGITIADTKEIYVSMSAQKVGLILGVKPKLWKFSEFDFENDGSDAKYADLLPKEPDLKVSNEDILLSAEEYSKENPSETSLNSFKAGAAWMYYRLIDKAGREKFKDGAYSPGQLTLEDAIKHCGDMEQIIETESVKEEHRLLKSWLMELKEFREKTTNQQPTNENN